MTAEIVDRIVLTLDVGALGAVSRFFNGTTVDVLRELLQNARRAGASRVDIVFDSFAGTITVDDDGRGIADWGVILAFGGSDWRERETMDEDPAGMGLFSLARMHCTIVSRTADGEARSVTLTPEHFEMPEMVAEVHRGERASVGTSVTFNATPQLHHRDVADLIRYYPLPVRLDGVELPREEFLAGAVAREEWRGVTIGVFRRRGHVAGSINFHGAVIAHPYMRAVRTVGDESWCTAVDVERAPGLRFVLPARREIVETAFLDEMRHASLLAIYRAMAVDNPAVRVPFAVWQEAQDAGVDMPEAARELPEFVPWIKDETLRDMRDGVRPEWTATDTETIAVVRMEPHQEQMLARAAASAGIAKRLCRAEVRYEGFPWYDELPRIVDIEAFGVGKDGEVSLQDGGGGLRPERIVLRCSVLRDGEPEVLELEADVALAGESSPWAGECEAIIPASEVEIDPVALAEMVEDGFFLANDDYASDSWNMQWEEFERAAYAHAVGRLESPEAGTVARIGDLAKKYLRPEFRGRGGSIRFTFDGRIEVEMAPVRQTASASDEK